jgi:phosphoglycolate phosphatase-like HAD superfamily hydrolase
MKKLLITDLDNTLYDWVDFYAQSFEAMLHEIIHLTGIERSLLLNGFKKVHQRHGSTEHPYAALEVSILVDYFGTQNRDELKRLLKPAFDAFNQKRKETLICYPNVVETLKELVKRDVVLVGHTEAPVRNALHRLEKLEINQYFKHIYTPRDLHHSELTKSSKDWIGSYGNYIQLIDVKDRKPNPHLLNSICSKEKVNVNEALYIGDSIIKDISMANEAGVTSVWASYGKQHNLAYWKTLVSITHWSPEDVLREEKLKKALGDVKPHFVAESFSDVLNYI